MSALIARASLAATLVFSLTPAPAASRLVTTEMPTTLVPSPLHFTVLLPDGYDTATEPYSLLLMLHGGNGYNGFLGRMQAILESQWMAGTLPKLVAVTPSAGRSFYMDYKDGSQKWETLITGPFLDHLRKTYKLRTDRKGTYLFGISMGGMGALRMSFKFPEKFAGLAALEPGIDPVLHWKDILPRHRFWRSQELMETIFGRPFDAAYWEANNPASIVNANPERIRSSGLSIYLDCGNQDAFGLDEATEFMHQILSKNHVRHEYHLVDGADHVGRTLQPRSQEALQFLGRTINPPPSDPVARELRKTLEPAIAAAAAAPPYPPSTVIRQISFAAESTIIRQAIDSDNWPMTWGDDDAQYTSYGDGRGFDPPVEIKLSLGMAKITGAPPDFRAVNLRAASVERTGDGKKGPKASGILMVDGVLYMWVRNTGNAQMVWSDDGGRTWHWGFRFGTSFGSPVFLNFGRNYAGARDAYAYVYSQDGPSAYESNDSLVLARVAKDKIRERDAYEFFVRVDSAGRPVWTKQLAERGAVFTYPGNCQRVDAVYNPGLRRYLLALGYNHAGGWGIYDAPEPWGPWTTAFHTENWGLGGTHGYRMPSKWISADGRTMDLVFSGVKPYDAFCVRRMQLD
jgi:S-formylglutathione hydrolase FrmB